MKKVLYVNACVREESRTDRLAKALLCKLGEYSEVFLENANIKPLNKERLNRRTALIEKGDYSDEMFLLAKQFADAEIIVISAPYWDNSFPSLLKIYIENIYVVGIVSEYGEGGISHGLCKAEKLYYVTTAGGPYEPDYSFGYIKSLAVNSFGIKDVELVFAENLDIEGNDAEEILKCSCERIICEDK